MANEKTPVVWDDDTKKHRPLGTGEKMGGLDASSIISSDSGNLIGTGSDGLAYVSGSGIADPAADNLIEYTDQGKLKVDADRIAEWLDGHPDDAAAIADAINAVSGDAGNVIVQGTDKGALLTKEQIAAALAGLTDAQKEALAQALAGQLASQLADGRTIVADAGKLKSDPTNATAAEKAAINSALADPELGLSVDPETGMLGVDFSHMPTDKFEELLKSLSMQVPLKENLELIVAGSDPNALEPTVIHHDDAPDEVIYPEGIGSEATPFRKIQDCVTYATETFSLGSYSISIRIKSGTYTEAVRLPRYNSAGGSISLRSYSGSRDVVINAPVGGDGLTATCVSATGAGTWALLNMTLRFTAVPGATNPSGTTRSVLGAYSGARVNLRGIAFDMRAQPGAFTVGVLTVRVVDADDGDVWLYPSATPFSISTVSSESDNLRAVVLAALRNGSITLVRSSDASLEYDIPCSGDCYYFVHAFDGGSIRPFSAGNKFTFTGTMTGQRYRVVTGSYVNGAGSTTYFPGGDEGYVEPDTCCWYK